MKYYLTNLSLLVIGGVLGTVAAIGAHNNLEAQLIVAIVGTCLFALALSWWYTKTH